MMNIEGVEVNVIGLDEFTEQDAQKYVDYVKDRVTATTARLTSITLCKVKSLNVLEGSRGI